MFRNAKKVESHIPVYLDEPLTGDACAKLTMELVKYIMYQKQQIPLSCDSLIKLYANSKPTDRNFSSMKRYVNSINNISNQLAAQFTLDRCSIKEIVIVIGATVVSPKLCIRLQLPSDVLNSNTHVEYQHSFRKPLLIVMRSILESSEFQDAMTTPLALTRTFILIQKADAREISEYFLPAPQFVLSSLNTVCFCIRLNYNENNQLSCNCENLVKVHRDSMNDQYYKENYISDRSNNYDVEIPYQWYQSREIFQGFKFLK